MPVPQIGIIEGFSLQEVVVLKLVASCRWNCGLDKLSTILKIKTLYRQPAIQAAA